MKKISSVGVWLYLIIIGIIIVILSIYFQSRKEEVPVTSVENIIKNTNQQEQKPEETKTPWIPIVKNPEIPTKIPEVPTELNLDAPFYSQAPFSDWSYPWQEACEEASILLAANVYGKHNWTRTEFNDQILKMVEWEKEKFGTYLDTTVAQNAQIFNDYLGIKTITHENPSLEDIKTILSKGHFIIMFVAGKELNNPNFTNGGPLYHAMLVKWYKDTNIITHDVGTRNGANYVYSWATLQSAMHDFAVPIDSGAKKILEVLP